MLGNRRRSGQSSYWTGSFPVNAAAGTNKEVPLTLKEPITIPSSGDATLTFWTQFAMEIDDVGQIEVAIDDKDPGTPHDWTVVDTLTGTFCADEPESVLGNLEPHAVDLTTFKGKDVLIRFNWILGATEGNRCNPGGWYIDDIQVEAGTFKPIGTSEKEEFVVQGRPNGTWAYRVLGIYTDEVATAPSNVEVAKVTQSRDLPAAELKACLAAPGTTILGSVGNDTLIGTAGPDALCGFGGNDKLKGLDGDDTILAGDGDDRANGGSGNDTLIGGKGKDVLIGAKGKDRLNGGPKRDKLKGGPGKDKCGKNKRDKRIKC